MRPERPGRDERGPDAIKRAAQKLESEGVGRLVAELGDANKRTFDMRAKDLMLTGKDYVLYLMRLDGLEIEGELSPRLARALARRR
jgi:hypothetical protein